MLSQIKRIACLLLLCPSLSFAQIAYQPLSFNEAKGKAAAEGKLLFVQFDSKECLQCNEVADKGLGDSKLSTLINQTFLPVRLGADHPDWAAVGATYNMLKGFGILFINADGTLIHRMGSSSSMPTPYFKEVDMALNKAGESMKISALEKEYKAGNRSPGFMETLLLKKQSLNLTTETLLNEYVASLPADSLQSTRTLTFIAHMAPILATRADSALRSNYPLFTRAWYGIPQATRIRLNNSITYRSMQKAIANKDEAFALRTATFAQRVHDKNAMAGAKAYDKNMLHFYESLGDTTKFFMKSIAYYERYFMTVSPDSIKRMDSIMMKRAFAESKVKGDTVRSGNTMRITRQVGFKPYAQTFTAELTEGAQSFYKMTANPYLLSVAIEWSRKALAFFTTPEALETYAKLLYKTGQHQKAIEAETEAMNLRKQRGFPTKDQEATLAKMKGGVKLD